MTTEPARPLHSPLQIRDLGLMGYPEALGAQHLIREQRIAGTVSDILIFVEHPPVFTSGRGSSADDFLTLPETLLARGFGIHAIERGGKTTYHGPGQVVGYPIISLQARGLGAGEYVSRLEDVIILALADMGLVAGRRPGSHGVWIRGRKIAAIGVHIRQGVSLHGFALNLNPDLKHFTYIVPCGIADAGVTSVMAELGSTPPADEAKRLLAERFRQVFGYAEMTEAVHALS